MFPVLPWRLRKLPVNTGQRAMFSNSFVMRLCGRTFLVSLRAHMFDDLQNWLLAHFCRTFIHNGQ